MDGRMNDVPCALTIAGSDSSGGAGIQLDLKVFDRLGVYGTSVIAAVTAQNSLGVHRIHKIPPRVIAAQIDAVVRDIRPNACKIGMLFSPTAVDIVAGRIHRRKIPNVVLDPVIAAKDGTALLVKRGIERMKRSLIPKVFVITPNAYEAGVLSGVPVHDLETLKQAAVVIHNMGCRYVIAKGGHLPGPPVDIVYDGRAFVELPGNRVENRKVHGTGCAFSAAFTARIALGDNVLEAACFAKEFVASLISSAVPLGAGSLFIK